MIVTIFKEFSKTTAGYNRPVEMIFERIKEGKSKALVEQLRNEKDKKVRDAIKLKLPAILFSGVFIQRNAASIQQHSGLICLDFDKFETVEALQDFRQMIIEDAYTMAVFISPSGAGLKVIVKIPPDPKMHKRYFDALRDKYNSPYFDIHCSDVCRICFESYDPSIHINYDSLVWTDAKEEDVYQDVQISIPIKSENQIVQNLMKWFEKNYQMSSGVRNTNLYILAQAFNDFGVNKNEAERICEQYVCDGFTSREVQTIVKSAYKKSAQFGTKFFEDKYTKEKIEQQIRAGKDVKQIKRSFPELNDEELEQAVEAVKDNISINDFWEYSSKGNISILHNRFKYFLQERNFFKFYPSGAGFIFINIFENLVEETSKDKVKDYVLKYLESNDSFGIKPFNYMAEKTKYFTFEYLSFLETKDVQLLEDTIDTGYLYFKNKIVKVSQSSIEVIDYIDSNGYVWKNQIIDRDYEQTPHEGCVFSKFLFYIAGQEEKRFNSLRSVIGYLLHSFKTSANNKAIILNDETISDTPNGGSGKGLFWNALGQMKKLNSLDGKTFSFTDQFKYQTVSTDCQILVFDDVKKNFDFESLFSLITEGITIERKSQLAIKLPVKKSPKILITTNYTVGGVGGSFERRKFEVEFSSYFNAHNTPLMVFNHLLFDEWDAVEWSRFDNFMIDCMQFYFANGLVQHEFKNLEVRKFINKTSNEWWEFTQDPENMPHDVRIYTTKIYEQIRGEYPDLVKWLTQKRLKMWIDTYATFEGLEITFHKDIDGRYFEIHSGKEKPFEITSQPIEDGLKF